MAVRVSRRQSPTGSGHALTCCITVLRRKFNSSKLLATFSFSAFSLNSSTIFKVCKLKGEMEEEETLNGETNRSSQGKQKIGRGLQG